MSNQWGNKLRLSIFGESHGPSIGMIIDGLPAGFTIDMEQLNHDLARRSPASSYGSGRKEKDVPQIISGILPRPVARP